MDQDYKTTMTYEITQESTYESSQAYFPHSDHHLGFVSRSQTFILDSQPCLPQLCVGVFLRLCVMNQIYHFLAVFLTQKNLGMEVKLDHWSHYPRPLPEELKHPNRTLEREELDPSHDHLDHPPLVTFLYPLK